jgi:chromate transporter
VAIDSSAAASSGSTDETRLSVQSRPTLWELFQAFLEMTLSGFGGVLAWAHRTLVERRGWLSEREFAALLGLCQVLPGGNIINVGVFVGDRFHGLRGVFICLVALLLAPFCLVLLVGVLVTNPSVARYSEPALRGAAPIVAGMVLAAGFKMSRPFRSQPRAWLIAGLTLLAIGILQLPLLLVVGIAAPLSIAISWRDDS